MENVVLTIHLILAVLLTGVVLLQRSEGGGLGMGGGGGGVMTGRQAASLAGLAPFARDSGTLRGVRTIFGGRAKVRRALFHVGRVGLRHNATLKAFYESLTGRGKPGKVALVACMRKALVILNALLRTGRPWTAEYAAGGPPAEVVSATAS